MDFRWVSSSKFWRKIDTFELHRLCLEQHPKMSALDNICCRMWNFICFLRSLFGRIVEEPGNRRECQGLFLNNFSASLLPKPDLIICMVLRKAMTCHPWARCLPLLGVNLGLTTKVTKLVVCYLQSNLKVSTHCLSYFQSKSQMDFMIWVSHWCLSSASSSL